MIDKILLAGFGGQGVLFIGKILAYAGMLDERQVCWIPSYGPEMRGGTANCSVIISDDEINSTVLEYADAGIVLNQPAYDKFLPFIKPGGALELIFPDMDLPISYASGRAFHLNISIYWPLIGMIGAIYFFFSQEAERELASIRLININFWLLAGTTGLVLGSLLVGFTAGREYLEAMWPLKVATAASTLMLCYNLLCTYRAAGVPRNRATLISMVAGSITLIVFYLPNLVSYTHPTTDEMAKFLVVHIWEEMSLELIGTGVLAPLLNNLNIIFAYLPWVQAANSSYQWN